MQLRQKLEHEDANLKSATKRCRAALLERDECAMTVQDSVPITWLFTWGRGQQLR